MPRPLSLFILIIYWLLITSYGLLSFSFAEEINLDPIIVTSSRLNQAAFNSLRATDSLDYEEIKSYPANSVSDLLRYFLSLDIRRRGAGGMQADLSIRGSNFEQTLVLLDGMSLNNPQTGHFNMDLPLTMFDIERIEVLKGQASSLYGPNAFAGAVNIITKKPKGKKFIYEYLRGEYNLTGHSTYLSFPVEDFYAGISYEYKQASSYKPETDFIQRNFYTGINRPLDNGEIDFAFGFMDKDFGASTFYSNNFPRQREHTQTEFGRLRVKKDNSQFSLYYRRHWDDFLLDRTRPGWNENIHTTQVYGGEFQDSKEIADMDLAWGINYAYDTINSTKLSHHARSRQAAFLELGNSLKDKFIFNLGLREDYYSDWGGEFSPNLNLGYFVKPDLKLRTSVGGSFRVPTYTELYYQDSANIGNSSLIPEHALSWEFGLDKQLKNSLLGITFFKRQTRSTIDWVREDTSQVWQANNIGEVFFKGLELDYKFININAHGLDSTNKHRLRNIFSLRRFGYTYIESDRKTTAGAEFSKYVLDHLQHQFLLGFRNSLPFGFAQTWNLNYAERVKSRGTFLLDSRMSKKFSQGKLNYEIFFEGTNLTNANYTENSGVAMPGRWLVTGIKIEF